MGWNRRIAGLNRGVSSLWTDVIGWNRRIAGLNSGVSSLWTDVIGLNRRIVGLNRGVSSLWRARVSHRRRKWRGKRLFYSDFSESGGQIFGRDVASANNSVGIY